MERETELRLHLLPAPDEPPLRSPEYQAELGAFMRTLRAEGIEFSSRGFVQDALAGGGWNLGEFTILSTLSPLLIGQLRKLIEVFLKIRDGRKLKLRIGNFTIEGHAKDVEKLVTPEQIAKMLEPPKKSGKKIGNE